MLQKQEDTLKVEAAVNDTLSWLVGKSIKSGINDVLKTATMCSKLHNTRQRDGVYFTVCETLNIDHNC